MSLTFHHSDEYQRWFTSLKADIQKRQIKAAIKVNTELLILYWNLGKQILDKQENTTWGEAIISPSF